MFDQQNAEKLLGKIGIRAIKELLPTNRQFRQARQFAVSQNVDAETRNLMRKISEAKNHLNCSGSEANCSKAMRKLGEINLC